jgi:hypothetical protein
MKIAVAISIIALGGAITLQGAAAAGRAQDASRSGTSLGAAAQDYDLSAAKKKKKPQYVQGDSRYVLGADGYYYPRAFTPADPSWQSPDMLRRRAIGECIIDLGYGRWESCSNAGRGRR